MHHPRTVSLLTLLPIQLYNTESSKTVGGGCTAHSHAFSLVKHVHHPRTVLLLTLLSIPIGNIVSNKTVDGGCTVLNLTHSHWLNKCTIHTLFCCCHCCLSTLTTSTAARQWVKDALCSLSIFSLIEQVHHPHSLVADTVVRKDEHTESSKTVGGGCTVHNLTHSSLDTASASSTHCFVAATGVNPCHQQR